MKALTRSEMQRLDNAMVKLGIDVPRMMELAGLFVAVTAAEMVRHDRKGKIVVMSGTGNNGGDSLVAARHLLNWGYKVDVLFAAAAAKLKPVPMRQWGILRKMGLRQKKEAKIASSYGLVIDGLLGYNISGNPRGRYAKLINAANNSKIPILAIDIPSGLDATTGKAYVPCISAAATIALTAAKRGLLQKKARKFVGKLLVSYMAVPEMVNKKFGIRSIFTENNLISQLR